MRHIEQNARKYLHNKIKFHTQNIVYIYISVITTIVCRAHEGNHNSVSSLLPQVDFQMYKNQFHSFTGGSVCYILIYFLNLFIAKQQANEQHFVYFIDTQISLTELGHTYSPYTNHPPSTSSMILRNSTKHKFIIHFSRFFFIIFMTQFYSLYFSVFLRSCIFTTIFISLLSLRLYGNKYNT